MQLRTETLRLGEMAGIIPPRSGLERVLDPVLEQARVIAKPQRSPRAVRVLLVPRTADDAQGVGEPLTEGQRLAQSRVIFPDLPEFMISKPSR